MFHVFSNYIKNASSDFLIRAQELRRSGSLNFNDIIFSIAINSGRFAAVNR
jgi:hypothetical protein